MKNPWFLFLGVFFLSVWAQANVLGNMQTFAPNPDSLVFQNVHSSKTLAKGYFNIGFFAAYVRNEISTYSNLVTPEYIHYRDQAYTYDLIFGYGMTDNLEFLMSAPGYLSQTPDPDQTQQNYISKGTNGYRPGLKYSLGHGPNGGWAVVGSVDITQAQENPYVGNAPAPIYNIELAWDKASAVHGFAANIGYRKRTPGDPPDNAYFFPIKDQLIASLGYAYGVGKMTRYQVELFSSTAVDTAPHPKRQNVSSVEALLGTKRRLFTGVWGHLGATAEILPEGLAPDYRVYTGINWFFGSRSPANVHPTQLVVTPSRADLETGQTQKFYVQGGQGPYIFSRSEPVGFWDDLDMTFVAPEKPVELNLIVKDQLGDEVIVPIRVFNSTKAAEAAAPLTVTPRKIVVYEGGAAKFNVTGGAPGYRPRLSSNLGSVSENPFLYKAPMETGKTELIIEDTEANIATVPIEVLPVPKPDKKLVIYNLEFLFDQSKLTPPSIDTLKSNIKLIKSLNVKRIIVAGHTDNIGTVDYNLALSRERAEVVAEVLATILKFEPSKVQAIGYGKSKPIVSNDTEKGRQHNRRVELYLYKN